VSTEDRAALVALAGLPSMGPQRLASIVEHHRPAEAFALLAGGARLSSEAEPPAHRALFDRLRRQATGVDPGALLEDCAAHAVAVLAPTDPDFPPALAADQSPPSVLFVRGRLDTLSARRVAVIGTRNATAAGRATASELGAALADAGVAVVSGLARGIDAAAHRGVRSRQGRAVAAVGNGLDQPYPKQNSDIWNWVAEHGLLLSEWPPGTPPDAWRFPLRNRLIAALAEVLVVVESRHTGGSLITARAAAQRDVEVMAVPGSTRNAAANGTNKLIVDGATPVTCVDDVLVALGLDHSRCGPQVGAPPAPLDAGLAPVLARCIEGPCTIDLIAGALDMSVTDVAVALSRLADAGLVVDTDGWFESTGSRLPGSKAGAS
jgi:DNA processing protein